MDVRCSKETIVSVWMGQRADTEIVFPTRQALLAIATTGVVKSLAPAAMISADTIRTPETHSVIRVFHISHASVTTTGVIRGGCVVSAGIDLFSINPKKKKGKKSKCGDYFSLSFVSVSFSLRLSLPARKWGDVLSSTARIHLVWMQQIIPMETV